MNHYHEQQAQGIHQEMALAALHLFFRRHTLVRWRSPSFSRFDYPDKRRLVEGEVLFYPGFMFETMRSYWLY